MDESQKRLNHTGAKQGDLVAGVDTKNEGLLIQLLEDQGACPMNADGERKNCPLEVRFQVLDAGTGEFSSAIQPFVGEQETDAKTLIAACQDYRTENTNNDAAVTYLLHTGTLMLWTRADTAIDELLGLDKAFALPEELTDPESYPEGAKRTVVVNAYERNEKAREECIDKHGAICRICGFDFVKEYGQVGRGIIHVHHMAPLAELGERKTQPASDLLPVCPNCHAVIHGRKPAWSVEAVKAFWETAQKGKAQ